MSLAPGPGRAGMADIEMPAEMRLYVEKHVRYIQSLDTVRLSAASYPLV
jgi:geranylgeranyl transferase type-2 subunit beta